MKNGYKIFWTDNALNELEEVYNFLEQYWTEKEIKKLSLQIEKTIQLVSQNPYIFQASEEGFHIRRVVILKLNSMYYRINNNTVEILSFFQNRKNPNKNKLYK